MATVWMMTIPASTTELARWMGEFIKPSTDWEGPLNFPAPFPRESTEQGFQFVVGSNEMKSFRLSCSGSYNPTPGGTEVRIRLRLHRENYWMCGMTGVPFGLLMLWGSWPGGPAVAFGVVVLTESFFAAIFLLAAWASLQCVRRRLEEALAAFAGGP
jgi:hypothetical protein